jgi:hypothetical protein
MMSASIRVAPSNSLVAISDAKKKGVVPKIGPEFGIAATESCILIPCLPEVEGQTQITLGPARDVAPGGAPVFDGYLDTPNGVVQIVTVDWKPLLKAPVSNSSTRIRIWTNRPKFPDKVMIGLEQ